MVSTRTQRLRPAMRSRNRETKAQDSEVTSGRLSNTPLLGNQPETTAEGGLERALAALGYRRNTDWSLKSAAALAEKTLAKAAKKPAGKKDGREEVAAGFDTGASAYNGANG